ncbi:MAG: hypothetical protein WC685_09595 [Methylobacter sp.]
MPEGDANYPMRWSLIKSICYRRLEKPGLFSAVGLAGANVVFGSVANGNIKSGTSAILKGMLTIIPSSMAMSGSRLIGRF